MSALNPLPPFYPENAAVPRRLETSVLTLVPLTPAHVHLDYTAVRHSAPRLRLWSGSPWPQADFTLAANLQDLEWHWQEHQERIAFTYTVLNPAETTCLGCVYLKPLAALVRQAAAGTGRLPAVGAFETAVRFWGLQPPPIPDLEKTLLLTLVNWFQTDWAFNKVFFHSRAVDAQQSRLYTDVGLARQFSLPLADRGGEHQFWQMNHQP